MSLAEWLKLASELSAVVVLGVLILVEQLKLRPAREKANLEAQAAQQQQWAEMLKEMVANHNDALQKITDANNTAHSKCEADLRELITAQRETDGAMRERWYTIMREIREAEGSNLRLLLEQLGQGSDGK